MLKHILTGQPSSTGGSRLHHHNDFQTSTTPMAHSTTSLHQHLHNLHNSSLHADLPGQHHLHHYPSVRGPRTGSTDVYDSVAHSLAQRTPGTTAGPQFHQPPAPTPSSGYRHPLNHSQLSVNNLSQRLNSTHHSHALNLSTLSTSKHSVNSVSPIVGTGNNIGNNSSHHVRSIPMPHTLITQVNQERDRSKINGGLDISRISRLPSQATPSPASALQGQAPVAQATSNGPSVVPLNISWSSSLSRNQKGQDACVKEMLTSLGLLCLVSLLLALLSLTFLLKISPITAARSTLISPEECAIVYEVTLVLCVLALSLNLCCLLVCAIQFLFTVKLVKSSYNGPRTNKYLQKSSVSRICAVGGFFLSIPVFLTGLILYTFIQFQSTPAIVMSVFIGLGIIFCGCAMVHNVFVWQREKTNAMKALAREQCEAVAQRHQRQQNLQMQHQQQQQQHLQHSQHQPRSLQTSHLSSCTPKIDALSSGPHSLGTHPRASQYQAHLNHLHHLHGLHGHRHISMSPPLLLSSPATLASTHGHHLNVSHRSGPTATSRSPPTTPGDRSPPSPANKLNRSQPMVSRDVSGSISPGLPTATLDLSSAATTNSPHELSTLV